MANSAVFALCVRSTGRYLARVLANLEALAGLYERSAFVFVENDSVDDSREQLKAWAASHADATVIEMDGLDVQFHKRTDRLAHCRNAYMAFIEASPYAGYDQLVMLDADEINTPPIDPKGFARGRDWLEENGAAAVFANSLPFYYDIYALRHPVWCPRNYSEDIRRRPAGLDRVEARQRFMYDRQIPIPVTAEPIEVESAFGGLGIYRMSDALGSRYVGLAEDGLQVCEHVGFNGDVARGGRRLYILPCMTAGIRRAGKYSDNLQAFALPGANVTSEMLAPPDYDTASGHRPWARTLPLLARLIGAVAPGTWAIDVGPGVGEAIVLCRAAGAELRFVAVEPSLRRLKCLMLNQEILRERLAGLEICWGDLRGSESPESETPGYAMAPQMALQDIAAEKGVGPGQLSLVILDTAQLGLGVMARQLGFLKERAPVLWLRIEAHHGAALQEFLRSATAAWPHVALFGQHGSILAAGAAGDKEAEILRAVGNGGSAGLDVALFPARFADLFQSFLAELNRSSTQVTSAGEGEVTSSGRSAVFALCARSVGFHLSGVLKNLEALAGLYDRAAFVFVENDSDDDTKALLKAWVEGRDGATLIELDGLEASGGKFTERMAACRNAYIDLIKTSPMAAYNHLVVMDADNINRLPIDLGGFARGRDWLDQQGAAGVFANSLPFYYDIFALRHPTWCPGSPNDHVRQRPPGMDEVTARRCFVDDRQIPIPKTAEPIEVQSAFGGLGIYRMAEALDGRYVGLGPEGLQTCEHVSFNLDAARSGRGLYILPWMTVGTDRAAIRIPEHHRIMTLEQSGRSCQLAAPPDHRIDAFRRANPLYDRRLPILTRLAGAAAPGTIAIDVGANVGDTVALCKLEGSELRFIAVEASLGYVKYLAFNRRRLPDLIGDVEMAWNFVGRPGESTTLELHRGTGRRVQGPAGGLNFESAPHATLEEILRSFGVQPGELSLVKLDTDGFDFEILNNELDFLKSAAPILWAEAETWSAGDDAAWRQLLVEATETWPYLMAFDNQGFAVVAGNTAKKRQTAVDMMSYARRHRAMPKSTHGDRPIHYIDVALFPRRFAGVFEAFCRELPELANG